jgi:polyisoprenoid-binding protein YceI
MTEAVRTVGDREFPAAGVWEVDPAHSTISFVVKHMMMAKVRGHFDAFTVNLEIGETPESSKAEATIDVATLTTGIQQRDDHLRSPDFFEVEKYPQMTFKTTSFKAGTGDLWELIGDLTIRETTRPITLAVEFNGAGTDPWGGTRAAFTAAGSLEREAFGLTYNQALETGGWLVGKEVKIEIEIEAVRK